MPTQATGEEKQPTATTAEHPTPEEQLRTEAKPKETLQRRFAFSRLWCELSAPWWSGTQRLAAWSIDTAERMASRMLELQEQAAGWAKGTSWVPLLESQHTFLREGVEGWATLARTLWQIKKEEDTGRAST